MLAKLKELNAILSKVPSDTELYSNKDLVEFCKKLDPTTYPINGMGIIECIGGLAQHGYDHLGTEPVEASKFVEVSDEVNKVWKFIMSRISSGIH